MLALSYVALSSVLMLQADRMEIAKQIAGNGRPHCVSHAVDGSSGPCLPSFEIIPGNDVNAWRIGSKLKFSRAAIARATPDEFALLAGHEIAHVYLGHTGRSNQTDELAADRLGARLACDGGFSPAAGTTLFRFLRSGTTHPPRKERHAAVMAVRCEHGS